MFKIGEKVVCINAKSANTPHHSDKLANGIVVQDEIYTIAYIEIDEGVVWLEFYGIYETEFESIDFRKLDYEFVKQVCEMINEDNLIKVDKQ